MYEYYLRISIINLKISSNICLDEFIYRAEPYSLYINYYISSVNKQLKTYYVNIVDNNDKKVSLQKETNVLTIEGNISDMLKNDYNKQFSLFGNKGIINRFVLDILENDYDAIILHGCAIKKLSTNEIIVGIGQSGSGKSVFVENALENGWKLIATEHVIIDKKFNIYKGNYYDNVSPLSINTIKNNLNHSIIYDKKLVEPLGEKVLVNYSKYGIEDEKIKIDEENTKLFILKYKTDNTIMLDLKDNDFMIRMLQISASEKITFPLIFCKDIVDNNILNGNVDVRNEIIKKIINSKIDKKIVVGDYKKILN